MLQHRKLIPAENTLRGQGGIKLRVLGTLVAKLQCKNKTSSETLYVIENQLTSLQGRDACLQLNLFKLMVDEETVHNDFHNCFTALES